MQKFKGVVLMKRFVLILFSVLLMCSFTTVAGAKLGPQYKNTNNASLNFYINNKGIAVINYTVSVKSDVTDIAKAEVVIEKHIIGPFWKQVSEKQTDTFSEKYHVKNVTFQLNDEGRYRAVFVCVVGEDTIKLDSEFEFSRSFLPGDVNDDSRVNAADARLILRYSAQLENSEMIKQRGDINADGRITAFDARMLLRLSAALQQEDIL